MRATAQTVILASSLKLKIISPKTNNKKDFIQTINKATLPSVDQLSSSAGTMYLVGLNLSN